jgi:hypothetical protein
LPPSLENSGHKALAVRFEGGKSAICEVVKGESIKVLIKLN